MSETIWTYDLGESEQDPDKQNVTCRACGKTISKYDDCWVMDLGDPAVIGIQFVCLQCKPKDGVLE